MCSIFGIVYQKICTKDSFKEKIEKMHNATIYRGPDENQTIYFDYGAIGMNRLSIIGNNYKKSMVQNLDQFYSVFNGEITNYKKLNQEFLNDIKCDSEIILPLFKKYNSNFVKMLGGMFSISIYDKINNQIFLWRDPLGIKPLYYYSNEDFFVFASEIKAIYSILDIKPKININSIDNILSYGFNPGRETCFYGINKVLPGEKLTYDNGKISFEKYWNFKDNSSIIKNDNSKMEQFDVLFNEIIKENVHSDVPGGFFLSGGLDSSLITAMALKHSKSNYKVPISIKFEPDGVEDEKYVKLLEKFLGVEVQWVTITPKKARDTLEELVKYIDEPLENPTHVGTFLMSQLAKNLGLKTVITGDGSDELFIGYERQECWEKADKPREQYKKLSYKISKDVLYRLYKDDVIKKLNNKTYIPEMVSNINDALKYERTERLPEYHNMRLDRMTMANSIEAKVPFEDWRIADFSSNLSVKELMLNGRKGWLKKYSEGKIPNEIIYRKKAIFPSLPNVWISGEGIEWVKRILLSSNSKINEFIKIDFLEELIEEHCKGINQRGKELWALVVLELWLENIEKW